ncbi:hypothetical protein D9C73_007975 [Collichthys lucidus]|uniref:Uncharacterized protein n=1 Tax=Collichthys lucidus TaxID=240159 RepID=A0A4U5UGP7_COLLU|nr:hypothetical protein D9C73_007975 [Collichthys lucidus]
MFSKLAYAATTSYNWSTCAISSVLGRDQMGALAGQLEEMKSPLQRAEENGSFQERKDTENAAVTMRKPSLWKQTCHFLGLRKKRRKEMCSSKSPSVSQAQELK